VDDQSRLYAERGLADFPLTEADGTRNALHARIGGFSEGSDHQVWAEGSWRVPVIYLADWPDIYIHTNKDVPANLDSTKMKRAIFIAAASAWALANAGQDDSAALATIMFAEAKTRDAGSHLDLASTPEERNARNRSAWKHDEEVELSLRRFGITRWEVPGVAEMERQLPAAATPVRAARGFVYRRKPAPKGPMDGFGYSWLNDHLKQAGLAKPALLSREASEDGPSFGYETLNLVDGTRGVEDIRDELAVTVAPAPVEEVAAYLATLEKLGVLERVKS
jgi:hypothetical protein